MSLNKVTLIGAVGQDPNINQNAKGDFVASFSLATTESWKDKISGERKQNTDWHKIVVFGNLAGVVQKYIKKGSKLYVEGQLKTRDWTDKEGIKRYTTEVVLQGFNCNLQMLDSKNTAQAQHEKDFDEVEKAYDANNSAPFHEEVSEDIPF